VFGFVKITGSYCGSNKSKECQIDFVVEMKQTDNITHDVNTQDDQKQIKNNEIEWKNIYV
jgi:hypothetical protein